MNAATATVGGNLAELLPLVRELELRRLDLAGHVYLDYTGAALYPETLVREHTRLLRRRVLGNPHSTSPAAQAASADIASVKRHILRFFQADRSEYDVCLTANASAAIRLVGEAFPFNDAARLVLAADNHNSVSGIREFARARAARVEYLPLDDELRLDGGVLPALESGAAGLLAFPAQSNFSGVRHSLELIAAARAAGYHVLLDAAAYVPTAKLSLRAVHPDFVAISFYKMFGYPTGMGALIARRAALRSLSRPWFAGGTVEFVSLLADTHQRLEGSDGFEDGTSHYLGATAVSLGLSFLERVGIDQIGHHVQSLTLRLIEGLAGLRHGDGSAKVRIYGPTTLADRGGTVAFNLLDASGAEVDYERVLERAARANISLRGGCFCNPGAAERAFGYAREELEACLERCRSGFSHAALRTCLNGKPVGALRASLGYGSTARDVDALIALLT